MSETPGLRFRRTETADGRVAASALVCKCGSERFSAVLSEVSDRKSVWLTCLDCAQSYRVADF